jgi:hypothetical protein
VKRAVDRRHDLETGQETRLSIGEVAQQTGLTVHALRHYEREGLLVRLLRTLFGV